METPAPAAVPEKSPVGLEIGAAILLCVDVILTFLRGSSKPLEGLDLATYSLGPLLFLLVILGIARLIGKAKTRRSRAFIAFVFLVIVLISQLSHLNRQSERRQSSSIPGRHGVFRGLGRLSPPNGPGQPLDAREVPEIFSGRTHV